jgi:hypothetical protein
VNSMGSSVHNSAATHTLPRCGTDLFATETRETLSEKQEPTNFYTENTFHRKEGSTRCSFSAETF